jgi:cell division protein FtsB
MISLLDRLLTAVLVCCVGGCVGSLIAAVFDDQPLLDEPSPAAVADLATLSKRVTDLEQRVQDLESGRPAEPPAVSAPAAEDLPVVEIHSETWCGPCQTLKADLAALGEAGVTVKWVRFSDRVPALRWTGADGKQVVQTGYTRGTIGSLLERVRAAHIARAGKSE